MFVKLGPYLTSSQDIHRLWGLLWVSVAAILAIAVTAGCGSDVSPVGNTSVTLLSSSTANDKLSMFQISILSLTLTSQSGETVSLFSSPAPPASTGNTEFMHVNGTAEPLATVA